MSYLHLGRCANRYPALVPHLDGQPLIVHRVASKMGRSWNRIRLPNLPGEDRAQAHYDAVLNGNGSPESAFSSIYEAGEWARDGGSGTGSKEPEARPYLTAINALIGWHGWRRVVDLGSGDGWVCSQLQAAEKIGVECVGTKVDECRQKYPGVEWHHLDLDKDREQLPSGDVALMKDVLHHAPESFIRSWIPWARTCGKWGLVLLTQDNWQHHPDCAWGGYRALDIGQEPLRSMGGLREITRYLHKSILMLDCATS